MADIDESYVRLAAARADFLDSGDASGAPDIVAASWRRSRGAGVDQGTYRVAYHADIDTDSRLIRCAEPILRRLEQDLSDVPVCIALADSRARLVDRRDCSAGVGRVLDRVDFNPGFSFAEGGVGTNGVGTVFEAGMPVSVVGSAHFHEALTPFACTGAPVVDPITGRLEGVLDVSLLAGTWNSLIQALVRSAAADIGNNLMLDRTQAQQALFASYLNADARSHHAVVAVGDTVIMNRRAQQLLSWSDSLVLQEHARFLMDRGPKAADVVALPDGGQVHLRAIQVTAGGETTGMVLLISELAGQPEPAAAPGPRHRAAASHTPAWNQAWHDSCAALSAGSGLVVIGETGTGRRRLLREAITEVRPELAVITIDGAALERDSADETVDRLATEPGLLVLEELETIGAAGVAQASRIMDELPPGCQLAATMDTAAPQPAIERLLARFDHSVRLPALRHRSQDIAKLAESVLADLAPDRRLRFSPKATRVLSVYSWPGNLPQLREVVAHAVDRRPVGEIRLEDLPAYCRATRSTALSPLESVERDAIVGALHDHAGNRLQAAAALGMSRSSLYRKIKHYGLNDI